MARKIPVLHATSDVVSHHVKKSVARLMVRRLYWIWEKENEIARIQPSSNIPLSARSARPPSESRPPRTRYVPETLPPLQIPGVRFEQPKTEQWRERQRHCVMH